LPVIEYHCSSQKSFLGALWGQQSTQLNIENCHENNYVIFLSYQSTTGLYAKCEVAHWYTAVHYCVIMVNRRATTFTVWDLESSIVETLHK